MEAPKFNNKPNPQVWISRAPAVVGITLFNGREGLSILLVRRSDKMPDEPGKFCMPCGYLDWNESGYESVTREIYEETSFYIPNFQRFLSFDNNKQPYFVQTDPNLDKKQNVTLFYLHVFNFINEINSFPTDILKYTDHETAEVLIVPLNDFFGKKINFEWAFRHDERIPEAVHYFNKNYGYDNQR